jgi:hypothetical protein
MFCVLNFYFIGMYLCVQNGCLARLCFYCVLSKLAVMYLQVLRISDEVLSYFVTIVVKVRITPFLPQLCRLNLM